MLHVLERSQLLPASLDQAWEFFSHPGNLARITPPWLDFTVCCEVARPMYAGQMLRYTVRPLPELRFFKVGWLTEITRVREPYYFVDEQRMGPYRLWRHGHFFTAADGGVQMRDEVYYAMKFGLLGDALHALLVRRRLDEIFNYRRDRLQALFA